ncbi:chaperone NapD for the signal peptide of nitrate reductase NapAB [Candidatus Kryptonium thompsonii]|jgi:nitrate reductase NapAB chaperone NapD|uniref:Chaperone NapD for the signal peptide of nitrate reductase NapAB n=1 Tax=Candidatus Kryptonium thompsonii TaxID=1633631 RepID=A0A0P1MZ39_9BACT|nr:chaperone NapD [Candidatus Kryptonium thompsoni]CUS76779.1 chaperone NapD for the signal peptide of nitrate reductase NapAB [Candidatus Kryptonium thompsoni]CUS76958.1 chaperone NapD for the signal peptide of nitrate reductase NapAB [Candidatus Kryptonium thompsoni]CUS80105.1 chaperone NapD for the signal peptide of nitrate reductase NapAB [Candidatus Kryptonium thompsoni]CUS80603.1 chaperone NapD for the signal peptide of nitrate reductase NapAB [Candidatus Kryptonium thompsoni]CUS84498.1 
MIIASGYIEAHSPEYVPGILDELKSRGIEVPAFENEKVVFVLEGDTEREVKIIIENLRELNGVREVFLSYYTVEGADKGSDFEV